MTISHILTNCVKKYPKREAIVYREHKLTYADVQRMTNQFANSLKEEGIEKGDRVAVLLRNRPEAIIAFFAISKIGATEVALNVTTDSPESINYKLKECEVKALITTSIFEKLTSKALPGVPSLRTVYLMDKGIISSGLKQKIIFMSEVFKNRSSIEHDVQINDDNIAIIAYTSGTTGVPKGIILTHANLISVAKAKAKDLKWDENRCLLLIPLYHAYSKMILNSCFWNGACVVLIENIAFPAEILKVMQKEEVTGLVGVPTIYKMILNTIKNSERNHRYKQQIKYLHTGGAKMPIEMFLELWKVFPNAAILSGYGLTETASKGSVKIFLKEPLKKDKLNSCGKPLSPFEMSIVDEAGHKVESGKIGEVILRGPNVMRGYWRKPEETEKVLRDGWVYTGDLGKTDEEGELYLVDRKKDMIKSGGELIAPKEIEIIIDKHPGVKESAVIGTDDELMGEKIKAFVILKPDKNAKEEEIIKFCSEYLPPVKIPSSVEFRSSLPKSTLDKVKKSELKRQSVKEINE